MYYYQEDGQVYCSLLADLPFASYEGPLPQDTVFLFQREPAGCRAAFAVSDARYLIQEREGVHWLDGNQLADCELDPLLTARLQAGALRAVNLEHPRWRELARVTPLTHKLRLNLLALGDVGSTLLIGLCLLGGEKLGRIGICDLDENLARRWEFELNQVARPWDYDSQPQVDIVRPEQLFDCDVFVFCASKGLPPVGSAVKDVRMAQFESNAQIVGHYARQAREANFGGLFAVVSDPVDPLCKVALLESNKGPDGTFDGQGLLPERIQGYGLGVMNARAAYYAKQRPEFADFLTEGRAYGPHGQDLVIANSLTHYDDARSCELTELAVTANLQMREWGYKPYVAPALSSGALSLLATLRGEWHYSSTYLGGVYMGAKNRFTPQGLEVETLPLPPQLFARIQAAADHLAAIV